MWAKKYDTTDGQEARLSHYVKGRKQVLAHPETKTKSLVLPETKTKSLIFPKTKTNKTCFLPVITYR